jgi:hypothetical protein
MWIYLGLNLVCSIVMYIMFKTAPEGYQDETGFHYGKPKESKQLTIFP